MADVLKLVKTKKKRDSVVSQKIKEMYDISKTRSVRSYAILFTTKEGSVVSCYNTGSNVFELVGALESLKHSVINDQIDA